MANSKYLDYTGLQTLVSSIKDKFLSLKGGTLTGPLTLYKSSGDSPALIFQRGKLGTDASVDWRMYVTDGKFLLQRITGTTDTPGTWADVLNFNTGSSDTNKVLTSSYSITAPKFTGDLVGNANSATTATNATNATNVNIITSSSSGDYPLLFTSNVTAGNKRIYTDTENVLSYNPNTNVLKTKIIEARANSSSDSLIGTALKLCNTAWTGNMQTAMDFYNGAQYTVPNARISVLMKGSGSAGGTMIFSTQTKHASTNPNTNGLVERMRIDDNGLVKVSGNFETTGAVTANTVTAETFTGDLDGNATSATNLAGGAAGSIPYQTAAGTTAMLAKGSSGQVLKINSSGVPYWTTDNNSDTKVKQTAKTDNVNYPILLGPSGGTSGTAYEAYYDSGVTLNPSTNTLTSTYFDGKLKPSLVFGSGTNAKNKYVLIGEYTATYAWHGFHGLFHFIGTENTNIGTLYLTMRTGSKVESLDFAKAIWTTLNDTQLIDSIYITQTDNTVDGVITSKTFRIYILWPYTYKNTAIVCPYRNDTSFTFVGDIVDNYTGTLAGQSEHNLNYFKTIQCPNGGVAPNAYADTLTINHDEIVKVNGSNANNSITISHATSGVGASSYGPSTNATPAHGGTFSVPYFTVNAQGHITAASTKTITLPADNNTDTKVKQTAKADNVNYPILLGPSNVSSGTAYEAYYDSGVTLNPSTNTIAANISGNAATASNATIATKLSTDAGSNIQPVYFSGGVPVACTHSIETSVPADAVFTDTDTKNTAGSTNSTSKMYLIGAASQGANPQTYSNSKVYATNGALVADSFQGSIKGTSLSNVNEGYTDLNFKFYNNLTGCDTSVSTNGQRYAGTANSYGFPVSNNANAMLWIGAHSGNYGHQLGFSSDGRIYNRYISNGSFPTTVNGGSWKKLAFTSDLVDTKNTAGSTNSASKMYLIGATSQDANPQTYSNSKVYATDGALFANSATLTSDLVVGGNTSLKNTTATSLNLNGDIVINDGTNKDRYIKFQYANTDQYSWRIGYLGSGTANANYLVFQTSGTGTTYSNALRFGLTTKEAEFSGNVVPSTTNTLDLGSNSLRWNNLYAKTIYEAGTSLSEKYYSLANGNALNDKVTALGKVTKLTAVYAAGTALPTTGNDGDFIIIGQKEYVYWSEATTGVNNTKWILLGDTTELSQKVTDLINLYNTHTHSVEYTPKGTVSNQSITPKGSVTSSFSGNSNTTSASSNCLTTTTYSAGKLTIVSGTHTHTVTPTGSVTSSFSGTAESHSHTFTGSKETVTTVKPGSSFQAS